MKRSTSILALAGALAGFGTMASAQSGDVVCRDFLLMDEQQQGNIVLELVQTEDGVATTSDIEGDYAIGQVDGLITACEANPRMTTAEIAAEVFGDEGGDGDGMEPTVNSEGDTAADALTGNTSGDDGMETDGEAAEDGMSGTDGTTGGASAPDDGGADAGTGDGSDDAGSGAGSDDAGAGSGDADAGGDSGSGDSGSDGGGDDGGSDGGSDGGDGGSDS